MEQQYTIHSRDFYAYLILVSGVMLDQLTTRYGLKIGYAEGNPVASWLIGAGLWLIVDLMLLVSVIGLTAYISEKVGKTGRVLLLYPIVFGLIRLYAGIRNLGIII